MSDLTQSLFRGLNALL